VLCLEAKTTG